MKTRSASYKFKSPRTLERGAARGPILCLGTTPAAQRVMVFPRLELDAVNRAVRTLDGVAGKSINVAKVLQVVGARPVAVGFLGGDRGEFLQEAFRQAGIASDFVQAAARTRECVTVIDQTTGTQTELVEESAAVTEEECLRLREVLQRWLPRSVAVVLSGTIAPGVPATLYADCVRAARMQGTLTVVDAQGDSLRKALEVGPGLVKPNRNELAATVGRELPDEAAVRVAMRELCELGAERVVVTAGREPTLAWEQERCWRVVAPEIQAVNPIGSGDAFTAGLVWRLTAGDSLDEACRWATATGAANALTWMAGEVDRGEVETLYRRVEVESVAA